MKWTVAEVAGFCGGEAFGVAMISDVVIDSRRVGTGSLFVALPGDHLDGNDFCVGALANGAAAVMCARGRMPAGGVGVEVDDTLIALGLIGTARRGELDCPVVAITGSSGKTTTKDLAAAVLGQGTHAAPSSFNNEIGVPLTILGTPDDATAVVVEVGSRGVGHIRRLTPTIVPDVAVITNIGRAHLETFGTVDAVRAAKWELVDALGPAGVAVLPAADLELTGMRTGGLITFGELPQADVAVTNVALDDTGVAECDMVYHADAITVRMPLPGRHQPANAAAAVAVALALGRPFSESVARLSDASVSPWRMQLVSIPLGDGKVTVVNDAYNANPDSMSSALHTVVGMPGRRFAVLGKMHELGASEAAEHLEVGSLAADLGFAVVAVGDDPGIARGAGSQAVSVPDANGAIEHLDSVLEPGDVVLVKASRAAGLETVVHALAEVAR